MSLAGITLACSSKDEYYPPATAYPTGEQGAMPVEGEAVTAPAEPLPPMTPEEIGPTKDYTVKKGDSLWLIAKNNKTTIAKLKRVNQLPSDMIQAGQVLKIQVPAGTAAPTATPAVTPPTTPKADGGLKIQDQ